MRFHYGNAEFEGWWAVDEVTVLGTTDQVCRPFELRSPGLVEKP